MKSRMICPSQYLPEGLRKKVSPLGERSLLNAADLPPVSELESPKLNIAGKLQSLRLPRFFRRPNAARIENATTRNIITVTVLTLFPNSQEAPHLLQTLMGSMQMAVLFQNFRQVVLRNSLTSQTQLIDYTKIHIYIYIYDLSRL